VNPLENKIRSAFDEVKADEELKQNTAAFLQKERQKQTQVRRRPYAAAFASLFLLVIAGIFSWNLYFTKTAYVDIDVNPSIELSLNRFNRVIDVHAYNADAEIVLRNVSIRNKTCEEAVEILIDEMDVLGYLEKPGMLTATVQVSDSSGEDLLDSLSSRIRSCLQKCQGKVNQEVYLVDSAAKADSYDQDLTPARYQAIRELQTVDPDATFENCHDSSLGELRLRYRGHAGQGEHKGSSDSAEEEGTCEDSSPSSGEGNYRHRNRGEH